eukprot:6915827-Alexandrium_andersonii.AAC.1
MGDSPLLFAEAVAAFAFRDPQPFHPLVASRPRFGHFFKLSPFTLGRLLASETTNGQTASDVLRGWGRLWPVRPDRSVA